ncbi:MAG: hypothetical protein ACUVRZ_11785 [Desulfobacca sp.]|uniref:hypothetical protein n=1 Tax=Desulfobacca sp. TaxID=2067990 RepID=UPI004049B1FD
MPTNSLPRVLRGQQCLAAVLAASLLLFAGSVEVLSQRDLPVWPGLGRWLDNLRFVLVFLAFAVYFVMRCGQQKILIKKPADSRETLLAKLRAASRLSLFLAAIPAVCGLVLFLVSGNRRDFYPLLVISLILLYVSFPRYAIWTVWSQPRPQGLDQDGST